MTSFLVPALDFGSSVFSPSSLSGAYVPIQWALDGGNSYETNSIDNLPVLRSLESYGTYRRPRGARCYLFDGTNDYATLGARLTSGSSTALTCTAWVKFTSTGQAGIAGEYRGDTNIRSWLFWSQSGNLKVTVSPNGTTSLTLTSAATINDGAWHHVAFTYSASATKLYIDGVDVTATATAVGSQPTSLYNTTEPFVVGAFNTSGTASAFFNGSMYGVRVYSVTKSAAEILAIKNQASTPTTIDKTGLLAGYWCNGEAGLTAYDWSGNGKHLTITNITTSTFHATDSGVTYQPANMIGATRGYYYSGSQFTDTGLSSASVPMTGGEAEWIFQVGTSTNQFYGSSGTTGTSLDQERFFCGMDAAGKLCAGFCNIAAGTTFSTGIIPSIGDIIRCRLSWDGTNCTFSYSRNGGSLTTVATAAYSGGIGTRNIYLGAVNRNGTAVFNTTGTLNRFFVKNGSGTTIYDTRSNGFGTGTGTVAVIPRNEANTSKDVFGQDLGYIGLCPHPIVVETPCITGDGTAVYADLGSALIPATANWSFSLQYYHDTNDTNIRAVLSQALTSGTAGRLLLTANSNTSHVGTAGSLYFLAAGTSSVQIALASSLTAAAWHTITVSRVGDTFTLTVVVNSTGTTSQGSQTVSGISVTQTRNTWLFARSSDLTTYSNGRVCDFRITTGGVTTYFPLQGGAGASNLNRDLPYVKSDGTYGVVASGIVNGTVSNIWANRCPGYAQDWSINYGGRLTTENQMTYSEQFDNAAWSKTNCTVTANQVAAPDGTTTADLVTLTAGSLQKHVGQIHSPTGTYSAIFYAKAGTESYVQIINDGDVTYFANFDIATGVVGTKGSKTTSSIVSMGGGWYRCTATFAGGTNGTRSRIYVVASASSTYAPVTSSTGTIYLWRARAKSGSDDWAGSYLIDQPTTASAVDANRFIPGQISGTLAADGLTKTLSANDFGNPYSRINFNYWSAPELTALNVSTSYAKGDARQSVSPVDTKYRRTASTGDDRLITVATALVGTDKSNMEAYET